jgi:hypothetical protein
MAERLVVIPIEDWPWDNTPIEDWKWDDEDDVFDHSKLIPLEEFMKTFDK